jgi:hypothetical protein
MAGQGSVLRHFPRVGLRNRPQAGSPQSLRVSCPSPSWNSYGAEGSGDRTADHKYWCCRELRMRPGKVPGHVETDTSNSPARWAEELARGGSRESCVAPRTPIPDLPFELRRRRASSRHPRQGKGGESCRIGTVLTHSAGSRLSRTPVKSHSIQPLFLSPCPEWTVRKGPPRSKDAPAGTAVSRGLEVCRALVGIGARTYGPR